MNKRSRTHRGLRRELRRRTVLYYYRTPDAVRPESWTGLLEFPRLDAADFHKPTIHDRVFRGFL
jgi:hypothetical protein